MPRNKRQTRRRINPRERPVKKVEADQIAKPIARIFPAAKRSASQPARISANVYVQKNAESRMPSCEGGMENSCSRVGAAMESAPRSMYEIKRQRNNNARMDQSEEDSRPSREESLRDESKALKARKLCNRNANGATGRWYWQANAR